MEKNQNNTCPICGYKDTSDLIIDLLVCNWCNHIFKKENVEVVDDIIENCSSPIEKIRNMMEDLSTINNFDFDLPSMVFETFELHPSKFYDHKIKHYFNQMSLMVLVKRCNLIPIEQTNYIKDGKCRSILKCRRATIDEKSDAVNIHTVFFEE